MKSWILWIGAGAAVGGLYLWRTRKPAPPKPKVKGAWVLHSGQPLMRVQDMPK